MSALAEQISFDDYRIELEAARRDEPPSVPAPDYPQTKARRTDPSTSKAAAWAAFPRAGNQRHRILVAIASAPAGLTYDGVVTVTGIVGVSTSTRITELARAGWIEKDGERKTSSGGTATVWVAADKARPHLEKGDAS